MKILVDADASPILQIVESLAREYDLKLIIVKNYNHKIESDYGQVITVDNIKEAADFYIMNEAKKGDLIVTQDYGLAAMVLGKGARVVNQYGLIIDNENIDQLLGQRHINRELRDKHQVYTKFKKRMSLDDQKFEESFRSSIEKGLEP